jgi:chemotaxis protein CheY-P-specific phosphatase CheC
MNQEEIAPGVSIIDALGELANIGAGNASTKLEQVMKEKVAKNLKGNSLEITPQLIEFCHLTNIELRFPKTTHAGFYSLLNIEGTSAVLGVFFSMESALFITGLLEGKDKHFEILREEDETVLKEIAKSVIDSYVESSAQFLNLPIVHTEIKKIYLRPESLSDFFKESIGENTDIGLLFRTEFSVKKTSFKGDLKIVLSLLDLDVIISAIRTNLGIDVGEIEKAAEKEAKKEHIFNLYGGGTIKNIDEMLKALKNMHQLVFEHHVTPFRNDFAAWVHDALEEKELALKLGPEKTKDGLIRVIEEYKSKRSR